MSTSTRGVKSETGGLSNEERLERLSAVLGEGGRLLVLTHDNPDPDGLASAYALLKLVEALNGTAVQIQFGGFVGRAENHTMIRELGLPFPLDGELDFDGFDLIALVDTQPQTGNNCLPPARDATIVIDHHTLRPDTRRAKYVDVRPDCGATCTILTEYLQAAGVPLTGALATALFYGIQSETQDLGREARPNDIKASEALYPGADRAVVSRIRHPDLSRQYFRSLHRSLERARTRGPVVICTLGRLDYPDLVAELADFFLRLSGADWAICSGQFEDNLLISIRTSLLEASAGILLRRVVGSDGSAGGHGMIAGARIPVAELSAEEARLKSEEIVHRFLKELGVEDEEGAPLLDAGITHEDR